MKFQYVALALAATLGPALADDQLPACATECATNSLPSSCNKIDIGCICAAKSFITNISCCVATKCKPEEQQAALDFAKEICGGAGVTGLPTSASCESSSTASTTTKSGAETSTTSTATVNGAETSATSTKSSAETSASSTKTESTPASSTTPTHTPTPTNNGAAIVQGKEIGLLAAIAAAVAFIV